MAVVNLEIFRAGVRGKKHGAIYYGKDQPSAAFWATRERPLAHEALAAMYSLPESDERAFYSKAYPYYYPSKTCCLSEYERTRDVCFDMLS